MHERFIRAVQEDWDLERIKSIAKDDDITKEVGKKDKRVKVGEKDSSKSFAVAVTVNPSASVIDGMTGRDKYGSTVMEWAGGRGRIDVVNWVVDTLKARNLGREGKNTKRTREGRTFLHFASQYGHLEMVKYVLEDVKIHGRDSKYSSHIVQDQTVVGSFYNHCIDATSNDGTTVLHSACYGGRVSIVEHLIELGADRDRVNMWGCGVGHFVGISKEINEKGGVKEIVELLGREVFEKAVKCGHGVLHKTAIKGRRRTAGDLRVVLGEGWWTEWNDREDEDGKKPRDWGGNGWDDIGIKWG